MKRVASLGLAIVIAVLSLPCFGRPVSERVKSASQIIVNRQTSALTIPRWVIDQTKCVASLKVVKAGLIWGGQGSTGLVSCRTKHGRWSAPSFFSVDGVSFG